MPAGTPVLTLPQYAMMSNVPRIIGVTNVMLQAGSILADIPMRTDPTLWTVGARIEGGLPKPTYAKLNSDPTLKTATPRIFQEQSYLIRDAIDTDIVLMRDKNQYTDPRALRLNAWLKGFAFDFNDKFINNNHISGEDDAPVGIRARLDNPTTWGIPSEMKVDAGGVDLSVGGASSTTANNFITLIQQVLDFMGEREGNGVICYCNDYLLRAMERAVRMLGAGAGFRTTEDAYGRMVTTYRNMEFRDVGRKLDSNGDITTTRIITHTETAAGADGASTFTSAYFVKYGEDIFDGWHFAPLPECIEDLGRVGNSGGLERTLINYVYGFKQTGVRCLARLYNIKLA